MKSKAELNEIIEMLGKWIIEIELNNAINLYDINKISENFALKLLNEIYSYNLENLNDKKVNYPGIDLGDETYSKIAFQVTSRTDSNKIKLTLDSFMKNGYDKIFTEGIRFLILAKQAPRINKNKYKPICPMFDRDKHIITTTTLTRDIEKLFSNDYEKFNRVKSILLEEFGNIDGINSQIISADEYFETGKYQKALDEYISLQGSVKNHEKAIHIKYHQGLCYYNLAANTREKEENLENSIKCFKEAIQLAGDAIDFMVLSGLADSYFSLSSIRNAISNLELSKKYQIMALEKCEQSQFPNEYVVIQNGIAIAYENIADHICPKENLDCAIAIYNDIINNNDIIQESMMGIILNNIGRIIGKSYQINSDEKNLHEAISWYNEALNIRDIERYPFEHILTLNNLGNIYLQLSMNDESANYLYKALNCYKNVIEVSKEKQHSDDYCHALNNMGLVYYRLYKKNKSKQDILESIMYFRESLEYKKLSEKPIKYAYTQNNLGLSYLVLSENENEVINLDCAINAFENSVKVLKNNRQDTMYITASNNLNIAYTKKGLLEKNIDHINNAINNLLRIINSIEINLDSYIHQKIFGNLLDSYIGLRSMISNLDEVLEICKGALTIFLKYSYDNGIAFMYNYIGIAYLEAYEKSDDDNLLNFSIENLYSSIQKYKMLNDKYNMACNSVLLGKAYGLSFVLDMSNKENFNKAKNYLIDARNFFNCEEYEEYHNQTLELLNILNELK